MFTSFSFGVTLTKLSMISNIFRSHRTRALSKFRIIKNVIVISVSFLLLYTGAEGLLMLQTTINKDGIGATTIAVSFVTSMLTSLLFSSFLIKKLGSKISMIIGFITHLPFIVFNVYPTWFTMMPSAVLRGISNALLWASQCTYFNESSIQFCKISNKRSIPRSTCNTAQIYENTSTDKEVETLDTDGQKVEQLSITDLQHKADNIYNPVSNGYSTTYFPDTLSSIRLVSYKYEKDGISENQSLCIEKNVEVRRADNNTDIKMLYDSEFNKKSNDKKEIFQDALSENTNENQNIEKYQSTVDKTKSLFFGIHGLVYNSATVWSSLLSYYILETTDKEDSTKTSQYSCGAKFCSTNGYESNNNIKDVPNGTRYLLIGVCTAFAIMSPLLMWLFCDAMDKTKEIAKLSWDHIFATIKHVKKKDQLLLIPFTVGASLCRGFYIADFTKSYIACAWSISHIGLITAIYGATAALSSILSGVVIKYVGRISVLVLCQVIIIGNFVFLLFWIPNALQPYLFYAQGGIFGIIAGILNSQTRALYGILFEGDQETAFASFKLFDSIGWALAFTYAEFLCVSVKIYIVLAFSCNGLLGYLLAERRYSLRSKQMNTSP